MPRSSRPMKLPNGFGSISKMGGNRRNPFRVQVTIGWIYDEKTDRMVQNRINIGYEKTWMRAYDLLKAYHDNPAYNLIDVKKNLKKQKNDRLTLYQVYMKFYEKKLEPLEGNPKKRSTLSKYKACIKHFTPIHDIPFEDLRTNDFQEIFEHCGMNYPTLVNMRSIIKQLGKFAMQYDIITKDYTEYIDIRQYSDRTNSKPRIPFSKKEIEILWDHTDKPIAVYCLMMIYSGIRVGELASMEKKDVDLESHCFIIKNSKTEAGIRTVPIADKVYPFYEELMKNKSDYILISPKTGENLTTHGFRHHWRDLMNELGFEHTPHECRHTCITMLAKAKVDKTMIQKIVGHKNAMTITDRVYTHTDVSELLEAINKI